jgi:hypothetical protein
VGLATTYNNVIPQPNPRYYFVNAGILVVGYAAFLLVARNYKEKPVVPHHLLHGGKVGATYWLSAGVVVHV